MMHIFNKSLKSKVFNVIAKFCRFFAMHIFNNFFKIQNRIGRAGGYGLPIIGNYQVRLGACAPNHNVFYQKNYIFLGFA